MIENLIWTAKIRSWISSTLCCQGTGWYCLLQPAFTNSLKWWFWGFGFFSFQLILVQILEWCRSLHDCVLATVEVKQKKLKSTRLISKLLQLNFLDEVQTILSQSDNITKLHYLQEINLSMHTQALLKFCCEQVSLRFRDWRCTL